MNKLVVLLLCVYGLTVCAAVQHKIHPFIHDFYASHSHSEGVSALLLLHEEADTYSAVENVPFEERGQVVFDVLSETAASSQLPLIKALETLHITYKSYWLVNMIVIKANYSLLSAVAQHVAVRDIHPNFEFRVPLETPDFLEEAEAEVVAPDAIEWNINRVKAPEVWALGDRGEGFTVAIADTGVQWDHPALKLQYRGDFDEETAIHDYNWWDAVHATGSRCGADSKFPCDDSGHGTHCAGTAVGTDHASNQIGVAPAAKWIACRNMNAGMGTPQLYIECLQFFVAPTDLNGKNPDASKRPHVIGNSYGCPTSEGCVPNSLQTAVTNVRNAGIFMSVSAGNSGPSCSTVDDPPALYGNVFSVGALGYNSDNIASYSSRGPVTIDGSNIVKPDISAPGSSVRSSYPTNTYATLSGTSMASPHITGIIPLLWRARPEFTRDIASTTKILTATAIPRQSALCGGNNTQNNVYGYGEVDVYAAVTFKY